MANEKLGIKNVELLLTQYREERRRLLFQLENVRETIARLKAISDREGNEPSGKDGAKAPSKTVSVKRGRGRPRKTAERASERTSESPKRRRKKRARTEGYRLNQWDDLVIATITKEGMMRKEALVQKAMAWAKTHAKDLAPEEVASKITRTLQKLTGKRGLLATHRTGLERGYHYGLKQWFFSTTGAIRPQHLDKLVLDPRI